MDESTPRHHVSEEEKRAAIRSTRRFDLRRILGGLFVLYGLITTIIGLVDPAADMAKAGMPINVIAGIGMLVLGILFLVWDRLAPVPEQDIVTSLESEETADQSEAQADGSAR